MIITINKLILLTDWNKHYPYPSTRQLRHFVFHAETYGFENCFVKVGRRVLLKELTLHEWMLSQPELNKKGGNI